MWREIVPVNRQGNLTREIVEVLDILDELVRIPWFETDWELSIFAWIDDAHLVHGLISHAEQRAIMRDLRINVPAWS